MISKIAWTLAAFALEALVFGCGGGASQNPATCRVARAVVAAANETVENYCAPDAGPSDGGAQ